MTAYSIKIMCPNCMQTKLLCNGRLAPIWMLGELALYCQSLLHASLKNPVLNNSEVSYMQLYYYHCLFCFLGPPVLRPQTFFSAIFQVREDLLESRCPSVARLVFIINRYLGIGRSNQKISKNEVHFFLRILLLGGPSPSSQLVPNPFNWSPNTVFYRYLSIGHSNKKK